MKLLIQEDCKAGTFFSKKKKEDIPTMKNLDIVIKQVITVLQEKIVSKQEKTCKNTRTHLFQVTTITRYGYF